MSTPVRTGPAGPPAPGGPVPARRSPAAPAPAPPARPGPAHASSGRAGRRVAASGTPGILRSLLIGLVLASVAWGAVGAWTASEHSSGADEVVSTSEPLSLAAQEMYRSLSDADVTATTAFLSAQSAVNPALASTQLGQLIMSQRLQADLASAGADLAVLRGASSGDSAASRQLTADLTTISTGLQAYRSYVNQAQNFLSETSRWPEVP